MGKALSRWEQDQARRQKSKGGAAADPSRRSPDRRVLALAAAMVAVALVAWAAWPSPSATDRAANIAAFGLEDDPYYGDPGAPVVLVAYESPHCSSCQAFHNHLLPELKAEYFDSGRAVYHYVQGTIGGDRESNIAQECAYRHGGNDAFWDLTHRFYQRPYTYATPDLDAWLGELSAAHGLDGEAVLDCYHGRQTASAVNQDWDVGREHGARGTPSFWAFGRTGEAVRIQATTSLPDVLAELTALGGAKA